MKLRTILIALALAAVGAAGAWRLQVSAAADPLTGVLVSPVVSGDVVHAVQATGTLRPVRLVAVGSQVSGRIVSLPVKVGQRLKAGDLVASIDSLPQQNDLRTAEAALADMKAQRVQKQATLGYQKSVLAREEKLVVSAATSRDSFESAKANVAVTEGQIESLDAQIAQAQVKIDAAKVNLGYTRITSPIDGTVLLVAAQEGQTVNAVQSAPTVAVIGQVDSMTVRAEISEADVPSMKIGQKAVFSILGLPDRQWEARLESLDPAPDNLRSDSEIVSSSAQTASSSTSTSSTAVYYYGRFVVPNEDGLLRTYMTANVSVVLGEAKGVPTVPTAAVSKDADGQHIVEVVGADKAIVQRRIAVGLSDKVRYEVKSGLSIGDRVVVGRRSTNPSQQQSGPPSPL
ncbi:efflux RND transporter periplasmic adaptor subunit [Rhodoplanes sp. Z2-YC6860]|uniref:efflux RND transporter periplasmic adaptor subunit n=1 Tax=Rhodoplanes sp. Z2-YC6860 TaxID=674703 RepID=UPI00078D0302|nr:efflux RND transporter periplasmic adaptor subunit [Rhodoplanes sp. Z2-YC6860]AMN44606.1 RND family efflux transporter, MFP subunit [Rhodoplanes sp. Z2-YC6860]